MFTTNNSNFNRIDAMSMLHLKFIERIRQTRGISIFASVYKRLDDLKDYEESERIAARIGAAFALAITKSMDAPPGTTSEAKWREMDLAPGIIADGLAPGEEIKSIANDRPSNLITDFRTSQIRSIAGGTNAGFSSVSKQYEGSYSSQRQELMEQNNIYHAIREEFTSVFVDRAYRSFVRMVVAQGLLQGGAGIDLATILDAEHVGRGIPYIEPKRETEADEKKVLSGFASRSQIILERGGNPQIVRKQIAEERKQDEEMDLNFSSTNSGVAAAGSAPGAAPGDEDDVKPADDEPGDEEEADRMEDGNLYEVDGRVYLCEDGELKLYEKQNSA
jgi:lambda family phage portal protein